MARRYLIALALAVGLMSHSASAALAAEAPQIEASWVTDVTGTSANLRAQINPEGLISSYRFEYLSEAAYEANIGAGKDGFAGAAKAPPGGVSPLGNGNEPVSVVQHLFSLAPATAYRFHAVATNSAGTTPGPLRRMATEVNSNAFSLLDGRGWEMVSPANRGSGEVAPPETLFGGGASAAAADGESVTYSSASSFGTAAGAPGASQYISRRGSGGWLTDNVSAPALSGSYGDRPDGVPFRLFSADLSQALMLNGVRCRGQGSDCPVANPPLPGSGAPAGYQDYYLRSSVAGSFQSLLSAADLSYTDLAADEFELGLAGAGEDLGHVVLESCAALSPGASEVAAAGGCDGAKQNLYEWSSAGLTLLNVLPGSGAGVPGAKLAAPSGAISTDGSRVYWVGPGEKLYLFEGGESKPVDESGQATFQTASGDGSAAFFTRAGHLYRYSAQDETSTDIAPAGGVLGVLGASSNGSRVYYQSSAGLFLWDDGTTVEVAAGANAAAPGDYPPAIGTARVSADGSHLAFVSAAPLSEYENLGLTEVYLYSVAAGANAASLTCVSCNPTGERPAGGSSLPGAWLNGSTVPYKSRALAGSGERLFFDSDDVLSIQDSNHKGDVYEWEASGQGSCTRAPGCVQLISDGRSPEAASFIDASADGSDVFLLTGASLAVEDPGARDLYDAREGGGLPEPIAPVPCLGDACQVIPQAPEDPTPGTLVPNGGNPPLRFGAATKKGKGGTGSQHKKHHRKKAHHRKGKGGQGR